MGGHDLLHQGPLFRVDGRQKMLHGGEALRRGLPHHVGVFLREQAAARCSGLQQVLIIALPQLLGPGFELAFPLAAELGEVILTGGPAAFVVYLLELAPFLGDDVCYAGHFVLNSP